MGAVSRVFGFATIEGERRLPVRAGGHEAKATIAAPNVGKECSDRIPAPVPEPPRGHRKAGIFFQERHEPIEVGAFPSPYIAFDQCALSLIRYRRTSCPVLGITL